MLESVGPKSRFPKLHCSYLLLPNLLLPNVWIDKCSYRLLFFCTLFFSRVLVLPHSPNAWIWVLSQPWIANLKHIVLQVKVTRLEHIKPCLGQVSFLEPSFCSPQKGLDSRRICEFLSNLLAQITYASYAKQLCLTRMAWRQNSFQKALVNLPRVPRFKYKSYPAIKSHLTKPKRCI